LELRFRFDPVDEYRAREHLGDCCSQLGGSIMYYARIKATMDHFLLVEGRKFATRLLDNSV
jgi:hypothetical protein